MQVPAQQQQQPSPPQRQSFGIRLEPVSATEAAKTPEIHVNGFRNKAVRPRATRLTLDSALSCWLKADACHLLSLVPRSLLVAQTYRGDSMSVLLFV